LIFHVIFCAFFISLETTIKASCHLRDTMTQAALRSKIDSFDTNPPGQVSNRFLSADVGSKDNLLPQALLDLLTILFIVLGAILTTIVVPPFALVALPPLTWCFTCRFERSL
jgi:ABC-type multidrug transport system fused ATPase/permease subunit